MDTSEAYIKMCDCEEVQGAWKPKRADYYVNTGDYADDGCDPIEQEVRNCLFDNDICVLHYWERSSYFTQSAIAKSKLNGKWQGLWLPRQDQIQAMMFKEEAGVFNALEKLWYFWIGPDRQVGYCTTLEQLWLAFYMHEKHGKAWDGEKWA